jgi:hypothetical protein
VSPTPGWNAQAFHFLSRVLPPPDPPARRIGTRTWLCSRRYVYVETRRMSAVAGVYPPVRGVVGLFVKRLRYGLVIPGPHMLWRAAVKRFGRGRARLR